MSAGLEKKARAISRSLRAKTAPAEEQVAAVCYRFNPSLEFLLVQTRGSRRWTFPKGGLEPGMTRARAAELEAFEEAGVHGRIEEAPFVSYTREDGSRKSADTTIIKAYLCEVQWLERPAESNRNPTWFSPDTAKRRLSTGRSLKDAAEFARVVDRAVTRVHRLRSTAAGPLDELQRVQFEAPEPTGVHTRIEHATFARYVRSTSPANGGVVDVAVGTRMSRVLQFREHQQPRGVKALSTGSRNR